MPARINIDGTVLPPEEAKISVLDHGFLFGDSVYETLRTYRSKPFLFARHFRRLEHSAGRIGLQLPWDVDRSRHEVLRTIEAGGPDEYRIRFIVTRGVGDLSPDADGCWNPAAVIIVMPMAELPETVYRDGVNVAFSQIDRSRFLSGIKTGNLIHQVLAYRDAKMLDAFEPILLTPEGYLSDGITSNIYIVRKGSLLTPSVDAGILEGITRRVVLDLARRLDIPVIEGLFTPEDIGQADEMFLTSSGREVVPITRVEGRPVGSGKVGPATGALAAAYKAGVERLLEEP